MRQSFLAMLLILATIATASEAIAVSPPQTGASSFNLLEKEREVLVASAVRGDNGAAIRLARYYDFVGLDSSSALRWFQLAAGRGDVTAQYEFDLRLVRLDSSINKREGTPWLEKAAAAGEALARSALEDLNQSTKGTSKAR